MGVEALRETERRRLRALIDVDVTSAELLHADDFQLVNPVGATLTKAEYLGGIAAGVIDYLVWEPVDEIAVLFHGEFAVLRYRARLEIAVSGHPLPLAHHWHTDAYELRDGRWQVVWSQATEIR